MPGRPGLFFDGDDFLRAVAYPAALPSAAKLNHNGKVRVIVAILKGWATWGAGRASRFAHVIE